MKYEVPLVENVLPVDIVPPVFPTPTPTTTKVLSKPTAHLPGDHGEAPGENTNPAFSTAVPSPTSSSHPTADVGWFPSLSNLVANQKWFFGAVGAVALFGIGMGVFFWRRRKARLSHYNALPAGDDLSMSTLTTRPRSTVATGRPTRELYDAFGELSDDDDENDEETALERSRGHVPVSGGLEFHPGFLDDEPSSSTAGGASRYHDDPSHDHEQRYGLNPGNSTESSGSREHTS